ncbi:MBL fold metallo-hydrolase [Phytoactinopolyspora halotolerans]|uniref:MBL fold metallo-hydrolase n=1 Tax=Phytoactinopolyspora halotolerans TaxID=1981512 RepID=A0A6L9SC85_9ACTN|nr:MBL fold metallo-hydrolase [Phytoactinopolyspora halotolerans]
MTLNIDHVVTSGTFNLDGQTVDVDNNAWVLGDEHECMLIDAPHNAHAILEAVGARTATAIVLTHGHDDHLSAIGALFDATGAAIHLHPADRMLWDRVYPDVSPDHDLAHGDVLRVGGTEVRVIHTPGHSPGSVCLHVPSIGALFSGDTLLHGGPGGTGRSFSDSHALLSSIHDRLFTLPGETVVHPGHGDTTTIGAEASRIG